MNIRMHSWLVGIVFIALLFGGCSNSEPTSEIDNDKTLVNIGLGKISGSNRNAVSDDAGELASVSSIVLTISASDMETQTVSLPLNGDTLTLSVPAGPNRVFSASAYDSVNTLTHTGSTTVTLIGGTSTRIAITLNAVVPDTTPPSVVSTSPANSDTNVGTGISVSVTFDEAMNPTTLNSTNFSLRYPDPFGMGGSFITVAGSVSFNSSGFIATFTPTSMLPNNTQITATLNSAITDVAGNALSATPYVFQFTTANVADTTPPTVTAHTPVTTTGISTLTPGISITFSEDLATSTVNSNNFRLRRNGASSDTSATLSYNPSTFTVTLTPTVQLALGCSHDVTVTTGVTDVAGNTLASNYSYAFTTLPLISVWSPVSGTTGVSLTPTVTAALETELPSMYDASCSLTLTESPSTPVAGTTALNSRVWSFTPSAALTGDAAHVAAISCPIPDSLGGSITGSSQSGFTTTTSASTATWSTPVPIETYDNYAYAAHVGVDDVGNVTAVWLQWYSGGGVSIYTNRYTGQNGWGSEQFVGGYSGGFSNSETDTTSILDRPLTVNGSGNAALIWTYDDGGTVNAHPYVSNYAAGTSWSTPTSIADPDPFNGAGSASIVMDNNGNMTAIWHVWFWVLASQYNGSTWSSVVNLSLDNSMYPAWQPKMAMGGNGTALVVWEQTIDGSRWGIWSKSGSVGVWDTSAVELDIDLTGNAVKPDVAMDDAGNAIAVWSFISDTTTRNVVVSRRTTAGVWSTPVPLNSTAPEYAFAPRIAMDATGNAVVAWEQKVFENGVGNLWVTRYHATSDSWDTPSLIENESGDVRKHHVAINNGVAAVIWEQHNGTSWDIWSNYAPAGGNWGTAQLVENAAGDANNPDITVDSSGNAIAVWEQYDGSISSIYSARFVP